MVHCSLWDEEKLSENILCLKHLTRKNIAPKIWFDNVFIGEQTNLGRGRSGHVGEVEEPKIFMELNFFA